MAIDMNELKTALQQLLNTVAFRILARRGAKSALNFNALKAGEFAVSTDTKEVFVSFGDGNVRNLTSGIVILGVFSTLAALQAAHPTGNVGAIYAVGLTSQRLYIWQGNAWTDMGPRDGTVDFSQIQSQLSAISAMQANAFNAGLFTAGETVLAWATQGDAGQFAVKGVVNDRPADLPISAQGMVYKYFVRPATIIVRFVQFTGTHEEYQRRIYNGAWSAGEGWTRVGAGPPVGSSELWFGGSSNVPVKYLLCRGQSISRTTYAELFAILGTKYGSASGTTFNLPDLRNRFPRGANGNEGDTGGSDNHSHGLTAAHARLTLAASGSPPQILIRRKSVPSWAATHQNTSGVSVGASSVTESTGAELGGSTDSASNLPPYMQVDYMIRALP